MAEPSTPSGRHRIRGFLTSRKRKSARQSHEPHVADAPRTSASLSASVTSSFTSEPASPPPALAMEGTLKKRLAKMPVMHDRYCVATWELDAADVKCVMLRSYKSRRAYDAHPEKPSSVHQLKCISDWDGKTGFHRYQHAFTMETRDKKLFQCVAPSAADKDKWLELMAIQSAFQGGRDMRLGSVGSLVPLRRTQSVESAADSGKPRAYTSASVGNKSDVNADHSTDSEDQGALRFPGPDGLFRTESGASSNSLELPSGDKSEPADWGIYGEAAASRYEVQDDAKPVLLDKELLDARAETKTLAADSYLFEEAAASRFGAVVVKGARGSDEDEDEDAEFVDEQFAAREARKENEQNMKRRAQKLESNRDLYAEMAAARLADMRKDARHPKKSHSHSRPSDESDEEQHDEDQSMVAEGEIESVAEVEDMHQRRSSRSRRSSKSHKKSFVSSSKNTSSVNGGYASGEDEEEAEEEQAPIPVVAATDVTEAESAEAEELRLLKKKYRAERRAKKRLLKEKEEEEQTALEAAELARAHREEQRAREEAKAREEQEKRDKKERREMKEKLKREKAKQRQAEAELRKLVELKQAEEERRERERKDKKERKEKKKSKKKEKYTSPAERIQKKEERDAVRAAESAAVAAAEAEAEVSNALVVVETPAEPEPAQQPLVSPEPAQQPLVAPEAAPTSAPKSTSSSVQTEAVPAIEQIAAPAPVVGPAVAVAAAVAPASAPNSQGAAPHAMPMYQVVPPPFVPSYPAGPQSMPAYGLAATFGAYPPLYPAPYSYGAPMGPQPTYMRPNMGFVAGLSVRKAAGPEPFSSQEEPMIGPQLPTPEERAAVSSSGASAPSSPSLSPPSFGAKLTNLPELPDVVEF